MDPFLNLENELDFDSFELRDLHEGRSTLIAELDELGGDEWQHVAAENETRFNALLARHDDVEAEIEQREAANARREARNRVHGGNRNNGGNRRSGSRSSNNTRTRRAHTPAPPANGNEDDEPDDILSVDSLQNYSLFRGLRSLIDGRQIDGFEGEVQQELESRRGESAQGLLIPWNLPAGEQRSRERRDITSSTAGGIVPAITAPTMIDVLRNRVVLVAAGARVLTNMIGTFEIPKKTAASSHYWVAEGSAPTESSPTIGQVAFSPETLGTFVDITRRLTKQTSYDIEMLMRDDIFQAIGVGLDLAGVNGSGSSNQPEGILQNSNVPTVAIGTNGGALDWDTVVELETEVADDNADIGSLAYIVTPKVRGQAKRKEAFSSTGRTLWLPDNSMNGYRAMASKQLPDNLSKGSGTNLSAGMFGNFADAVFALWGGIDLTVDSSSLSTSGGIRLVGLADADFQVRRAESFAKVIDIDTAL